MGINDTAPAWYKDNEWAPWAELGEWDRLFEAVFAVVAESDDTEMRPAQFGADPAPYLADVGFVLTDPGWFPMVEAVVRYAAHSGNDPIFWLVCESGWLAEAPPLTLAA